MRLYSAYINKEAAKNVDSLFFAERYVIKIYQDGDGLWELAQKEEVDEGELNKAERISSIPQIIEDETKEIQDIEALVNKIFTVVREGILLIHSQLDKIKSLVRGDDVLKKSGFPIEIADQMEIMLNQEMVNIIKHLRQMSNSINEMEKPNDQNNSSEEESN